MSFNKSCVGARRQGDIQDRTSYLGLKTNAELLQITSGAWLLGHMTILSRPE